MIFTNDNGGEQLSRHGPLAGRKGDAPGGGHPRPVHDPLARAEFPAGQVSALPAMTMDLTATILAAAGTGPPEDAEARRHRPDAHPRRDEARPRTDLVLADRPGRRPASGRPGRGSGSTSVTPGASSCSTSTRISASGATWPNASPGSSPSSAGRWCGGKPRWPDRGRGFP